MYAVELTQPSNNLHERLELAFRVNLMTTSAAELKSYKISSVSTLCQIESVSHSTNIFMHIIGNAKIARVL